MRRVKVGERVRLKRSADRVLVIEDRGDLGAHGEQVVRLQFEDGSECEVPVTWLEPTRKP